MLFAWPGLPLAGATRRLTAPGAGTRSDSKCHSVMA